MSMKKILVLSLVLMTITGCSSKPTPALKSPCVGLTGSPCGERHPVNGYLGAESEAAEIS